MTMSPSRSPARPRSPRPGRCRRPNTVPVDSDRQRDAAAVELFGNLGGRTRGRAAIDDARQQKCIAPGAPADRRSSRRARRDDRDGRRLARLLRDHDGAVVEHDARAAPGRRLAGGGSSAVRRRGRTAAGRSPAGSNQPIVRFDGPQHRGRAASATSPGVTACDARGIDANRSTLAIVSKYPSWCAMLVTLSLSKTSRALSCAFARASSAAVIRSSRTRRAPRAARLHRGQRVPSVAVAEIV